MAKTGTPIVLITLLSLVTILSLCVTTTNALMPYTRTLWDTMLPPDDPFRILEHTPLTIPRTTAETLALARADWKESQTAHVITLDLPGLKKNDIKIEMEENRVLRVSGERRMEDDEDGDKWHRAERTTGKFWRQFRLPANADVDSVTAKLEDGVLRIVVNKFGDEKKRQGRVIDIHHREEVGGEDVKPTTMP